MENDILVYIPSETKTAPHISMKRFLSVPQFMRVILTLEDAGYERVTLVAPVSERRHILKSWKRHTKNRNIKPHFVWTPANQKIDRSLLNDIITNSAQNITMINANLLFTKDVLTPWNGINLKSGVHLKAVIDRGLPPIIRINKDDLVSTSNEINGSALHVEDLMWNLLKRTSPHHASKKWNEPVMLITIFTPGSEVTIFLTGQIRMNTQSWIARNINKRISLPISVILAKLRISPNTITVVNMLIGMGAAVGAAGRTYVGLLIGAILFQLASIVDGCDGEVAKLTHRCTKFGQYIDSISDNFALAGFITGLMIHTYRVHNHTPWAFVLGGFQLLGVLILIGIMISFLKKNTDSASFVTFDKEYLQKLPDTYPKPLLMFINYFKYTLKKDFFSFMFLVFAIFGILPVAWYISIFGTWCGVFVLAYLNLKPQPAVKKTHSPAGLSLAGSQGVKE